MREERERESARGARTAGRQGGIVAVWGLHHTRRFHCFREVVEGEATGAGFAGRELGGMRRIRRKVKCFSLGAGALRVFSGGMPSFGKAVRHQLDDGTTTSEDFSLGGLFAFRPPCADGGHARLPPVVERHGFLPVGCSFDDFARNAHGDERGFVQEFGISDHVERSFAEAVVASIPIAMKERLRRLAQQSLVRVVDDVVDEIAELATAFDDEVVPFLFKEQGVETRFFAIALPQKSLEYGDVFWQRVSLWHVLDFDQEMDVVGHENEGLDRGKSRRVEQKPVDRFRERAGRRESGIDAPREARVQTAQRRQPRQALERDEVVIRGAVVPGLQAVAHGEDYSTCERNALTAERQRRRAEGGGATHAARSRQRRRRALAVWLPRALHAGCAWRARSRTVMKEVKV